MREKACPRLGTMRVPRWHFCPRMLYSGPLETGEDLMVIDIGDPATVRRVTKFRQADLVRLTAV